MGTVRTGHHLRKGKSMFRKALASLTIAVALPVTLIIAPPNAGARPYVICDLFPDLIWCRIAY
jgi:hypothetical protein